MPGGGAQTPHNNTRAVRRAQRGPRPNSGPPASPHPENSARPEKRATAGPATFDTGRGYACGPAGRRRRPPWRNTTSFTFLLL
ncbi:hypothetical protein NDU88_010468 [Pleurodeles waltl]|uniref:Uncharacterized protein n=1 Tax=Pleurodeles waltl TaxID=8319 RepID=A0AAV7Q2B1_PLEWA|nr:hypothetical protein NDU88_010468 [Pleurodeles waltl]